FIPRVATKSIALVGLGMSALGHVWTAPWQELSNVAAALVGCGHVSGLLMRRGKPLALMLCADRVPIKTTHFKVRWPKRVLPIPGTTVSALRRHALANWCIHAASNSFGSLYLSLRTMMAQAIRAILLASATAATFAGRRAITRVSQGRVVPYCRAYRMTAIAPATSSHRR